MKVEKGNKYYCIKDVFMTSNGKHEYKLGKVYISERDNCITDESKNKSHSMGEENWAEIHFKEYNPKTDVCVGDIVKVINPGKTYSIYDIKFKELNFKNKKVNNEYKAEHIAKVFNICKHENSNEGTLYALRDIEGNECLINEKGIQKATVSEIKNSEWKDSVDLRPNIKVGDKITFEDKFEGGWKSITRTIKSIIGDCPVVESPTTHIQYIVSWDYSLYKEKSTHATGYVNVTVVGFNPVIYETPGEAKRSGELTFGKDNFKTIKINGKF